MERIGGQPIVTVSVITYNSSKYVLETLDSIKAQTWHNLILQVCDDCSTDNTVELCENWIETNRDRFVKTKIIVSEHNTGVSANFNRSWDNCETDYIKDIAGDDLLLPNCIEDNMNYVSEHRNAVFVFSKPRLFGLSKKKCEQYFKNVFDYSFFKMSPQEQYNRIRYGSCLPAAAVFCNISKLRSIGFRHDERIPFLEDRPKWLNAINRGLQFDLFDKETVAYRIHKKSLCNSEVFSPKFYESTRLCYFYYTFQSWYKKDPEAAIQNAVQFEMELYQRYIGCMKQRDRFYNLYIIRFLVFLKHSIIDKLCKK